MTELIQVAMRLTCFWKLFFANVDRTQLFSQSDSMALQSSCRKVRA